MSKTAYTPEGFRVRERAKSVFARIDKQGHGRVTLVTSERKIRWQGRIDVHVSLGEIQIVIIPHHGYTAPVGPRPKKKRKDRRGKR